MTPQHPRNATSVPLTDQLADRWSPRSFDADFEIAPDDLTALGEAARWAPSANNAQPSRFIVGRRGTPTFASIVAALRPVNQGWAPRASVLIVALAETQRDGRPLRWAEYDLGQAVAHLTVEAESRGLSVRQMGGFDPDALRAAFALPPELVPVTVVAVGRYDAAADLPEEIRQRDAAPRLRRGLDELALILDV
nr:nitroreductase [Propionibacterium sp.]